MPKRRFSFPIGRPTGNVDLAFIAHLKSVITASENDFGPGNINAEYTFAATASDDDKTILALWDGRYTITNGVITSEAFPDAYLQLLYETLGEDIPVPKKAIYGPVDIADKVIECAAGDVIGKLKSNNFFIRFFDQNDFIINANFCLSLLHNRNLFESDQSTDFPFSRNNANDHADLLFNEILAGTGTHIKIKGGSFARSIYNPPAVIPPALFSFLSNHPIEISVLNAGTGSFTIAIEDVTDKMYHTLNTNPVSIDQSSFNFIPQVHLKSEHPQYAKANGKRAPGKPLAYSIKILSGSNLICQVQIEQDIKDIIRQEYLFHSQPFQAKNDINSPKRENVSQNNIESDYFDPRVYNSHNNYGAGTDPWLLNAEENIRVAEFMRWQFATEMRKLVDSGFPGILREVCTADLNINSSWRNPERNEVVGGVINSNHQFGRAEDLVSLHHKNTGSANQDNVPMHCALFEAARVFLERLIALNGAAKCMSVEILLEKNATLFLSYSTNKAGVITLKKNIANLSSAGISTTGTDAAVISATAAHASHVHVGWKSSGTDPLILPDIPAYDLPDMSLLPLKNIILVAAEDNSVPVSDQLPLPQVALFIKESLDNAGDGIETIILDVANPLDVLEWMGAYSPSYRINSFFFLGHAFQNGIFVKHSTKQIKDDALKKRIKLFYGKESMVNTAGATVDIFGTDDLTQFALTQFRVSNIRLLPKEISRRIRTYFKDAKDIFILGCYTLNNPGADNNSFCEELSGLLDKPVFGAGYFNKIYERKDEEWEETTISRSGPFAGGEQYVLATDSIATGEYLKYFLDMESDGSNSLASDFPGLLEFYKQSLSLVFSPSISDPERFMSLEIVETIDD